MKKTYSKPTTTVFTMVMPVLLSGTVGTLPPPTVTMSLDNANDDDPVLSRSHSCWDDDEY